MPTRVRLTECRAVKQTTAGRIVRMLQTWTSGESGQISGQGSHDIDKYNNMHDDSKTSVDARSASYVDLVNSYYNLATDFYEWGWGQSFHFAEKARDSRSPGRCAACVIDAIAHKAAPRCDM